MVLSHNGYDDNKLTHSSSLFVSIPVLINFFQTTSNTSDEERMLSIKGGVILHINKEH